MPPINLMLIKPVTWAKKVRGQGSDYARQKEAG